MTHASQAVAHQLSNRQKGEHVLQSVVAASCIFTQGLHLHAAEASQQRYIPPAARTAPQGIGQLSQLERRVRGLLNRMSDSNLPGIAADVVMLAEQEGERAVADAITAELLQVHCFLFMTTAWSFRITSWKVSLRQGC